MMKAWTIAKQELKIMMRSKWIVSFALLFTALACITVYFGSTNDQSGFSGFNRMTASLLNLSLFLIPLLTLLTGSMFLAGEREDGRFMLLLSAPISPFSIIFGKYIGILLALLSVISLGYGTIGIIVAALFRQASTHLFLFFAFSLLLMLMFLSVSLVIGMMSTTRFQALGLSLLSWALSVLFYEFIVIAITSFVHKTMILPIISTSVFLNPVELVRVWTIISLKSGTIFGPSLYDFTIWAEGVYGQIMFIAATIIWMIVPLFIAYLLMKKGV
jgi:Cu-processing system permease protein